MMEKVRNRDVARRGEASIQETKEEKQKNCSEKDTCTDKSEWKKIALPIFIIIVGLLVLKLWTDSDSGYSRKSPSLDQGAYLQDHLEVKGTKGHDQPTRKHSPESRQLSGRDSSANNVDGLNQIPSSLDQTSDTQDSLREKQKREEEEKEEEEEISCRDKDDKALDWYYIYNLPEGIKKGIKKEWTGEEYLFLSDKSPTFELYKSGNNLSTTNNPLAKTLHPIYQQRREISVILYSDQPPYGPDRKDKGHTKGVIVFDNVSGFWLMHSITRFPHQRSYEWPSNAKRYGQSVLCVTFPKDMFDEIAFQLWHMDPNVYYLREDAGTLPDAIHPSTSQHKAYLTSLEGQKFIHYAKEASFNRDLYSGFVATDLKKKMYVQTWRKRKDNETKTYIRSECTSMYPVCNVAWVDQPGAHSFNYTKDHSKWAVTDDGNYICIGDINRQLTQLRRGGGTMCAYLPDVAEQYLRMIDDLQSCPEEQEQLCPSKKPFKKNKGTKKGKRQAKVTN